MLYLSNYIKNINKYELLNKSLQEKLCIFVLPYYSDLKQDYKKLKNFANDDFISFLAKITLSDTEKIKLALKALDEFKDDKNALSSCIQTKLKF